MASLIELKAEYLSLTPPSKPRVKRHRLPDKIVIPVKDTPISKWRWMVIKVR